MAYENPHRDIVAGDAERRTRCWQCAHFWDFGPESRGSWSSLRHAHDSHHQVRPCPISLVYGLGLTCNRNFETIINRVLELLFAPNVSLRCLDRSVPKQKPNLFEFSAAIMAEPGTGAAKIVGSQIGDPSLAGAALDCVPDHVRSNASFLPLSLFRNSPDTLRLLKQSAWLVRRQKTKQLPSHKISHMSETAKSQTNAFMAGMRALPLR